MKQKEPGHLLWERHPEENAPLYILPTYACTWINYPSISKEQSLPSSPNIPLWSTYRILLINQVFFTALWPPHQYSIFCLSKISKSVSNVKLKVTYHLFLHLRILFWNMVCTSLKTEGQRDQCDIHWKLTALLQLWKHTKKYFLPTFKMKWFILIIF